MSRAPPDAPVVGVRDVLGDVRLFTVIATLGAPLEVTAANLAIETDRTEVLVVGAGPVGLAVAASLAGHGHDVTVDRQATGANPSRCCRARPNRAPRYDSPATPITASTIGTARHRL